MSVFDGGARNLGLMLELRAKVAQRASLVKQVLLSLLVRLDFELELFDAALVEGGLRLGMRHARRGRWRRARRQDLGWLMQVL